MKSLILRLLHFLILFSIFAGLAWQIKIQYLEYKENERAKILAMQEEERKHRAALEAKNKVNPEYLRCLATNIYHEARSEPFMGQVAVARVVMNRVKYGFASNPCRVIYQKTVVPALDDPAGVKKICQFSWVCEDKTTPPRNEKYIQAENIAKQVLVENKWADTIPGNILFFHNNQVNPEWKYRPVMTIGNHTFYSKK